MKLDHSDFAERVWVEPDAETRRAEEREEFIDAVVRVACWVLPVALALFGLTVIINLGRVVLP